MFKKKKIVLTSVLALAGVSLATVGFATWVVGLQKQTEDLTVQAIVDDSFNKSVYLEAKNKAAPIVVAEKKSIMQLAMKLYLLKLMILYLRLKLIKMRYHLNLKNFNTLLV